MAGDDDVDVVPQPHTPRYELLWKADEIDPAMVEHALRQRLWFTNDEQRAWVHRRVVALGHDANTRGHHFVAHSWFECVLHPCNDPRMQYVRVADALRRLLSLAEHAGPFPMWTCPLACRCAFCAKGIVADLVSSINMRLKLGQPTLACERRFRTLVFVFESTHTHRWPSSLIPLSHPPIPLLFVPQHCFMGVYCSST